MDGDPRVYSLEGFAVPSELDRVHELLERAGAENPHVDATDLMLFETAVIEIANNVVEHGRPHGEVAWRLDLRVDAGEITVDLHDSAQAALVDLDQTMPSQDEESGRGIPLANALLDEISITRIAQGNHWHLVRRFADPLGG